MNTYRNSKIEKKWRFHFSSKIMITNNLDLVNLGTTRAYYAFNYENLCNNAINLAGFTQTFKYDEMMLRKYSSKINKNAIILITIEYPIFLIPQINIRRKEVYNQISKRVGMLKVKEISIFKQMLYRMWPQLIDEENESIKYFCKLEKSVLLKIIILITK